MDLTQFSWKISRKTLVALVYVGIAIVLAVQGSAMTWAHVQFFDSMGLLRVSVDRVDLKLVDGANATIHATLINPTDFGQIKLWSITYVLFINSTTQNFSLQAGPDAGEFGVQEFSYEPNMVLVPARGTLNITYTLLPHTDILQAIDELRSFHSQHSADGTLLEFVGITLTLVSSFGFIEVPHCFQLPENIFTICPGLEVPPRTRFG